MAIKSQIIHIPISKTSQYTQLAIGNAPIARFHSRYNNTINLLIDHQLFALQSKDSELSPISLITDLSTVLFQQLPFQPNQAYQLNLNYSNNAIFSSKLTACNSFSLETVRYYAHLVQNMLEKSNAKGLNLLLQQNSVGDLLLQTFKQYLTQAETLYRQGALESSAEYFTKLIGLGIGLTPSGDDFLCGFIATFQYFTQTQTAFYQTLTQKLQQHLDNTNAISRRFLDCALQQQFSAPILSLFNHSQPHKGDFPLLAQRFENIGHSSGMDTLFGIYYACQWLLKG